MEHNGVTYLVNDSYKANRRTFLVRTPGTVVFDFDRFFSYAEMFLVLSGATSKRKSGMPRLSRRPSHWGYYRLSDVSTPGTSIFHTKRRVCSNSSMSMFSKIWSNLLSFRQSSVSLNCLKASWGTKRRARKYRLSSVSAPRMRALSSKIWHTARSRRHG
jgi:hypothetical protein